MGTGILICGMNGSGKSTLGKALAERINFRFIDNENLYFQRSTANQPYGNGRTKEEVIALLMEEVREYPDFVFVAVKGDYGQEILPLYNYIVMVEVSRDIRLERVRNRSYMKFGERMLPGGDLYEKEEQWFKLVESRPENYAEEWLKSMDCPVIRVDGTKPVEGNIDYILGQIKVLKGE